MKSTNLWQALFDCVGFDVGGCADSESESGEKSDAPAVRCCKCGVALGFVASHELFHLGFDVPALDRESVSTALQNVIETFGFLGGELRPVFRQSY